MWRHHGVGLFFISCLPQSILRETPPIQEIQKRRTSANVEIHKIELAAKQHLSQLTHLHRLSPFNAVTMNVDHEVSLLVEEIRRLGTENADGKISVTFGVLFNDDKCANLFEALVGTLRAAKRKKIVTYQGELLLQGVHDNVDVILL
ncbi:hypothetical protein AALO_G00106850 [Alosa alosa]|uniref:Costars family protein ABRACL n=2 Tax=Alosa TaxID=34772 RepID=A0AAV6GNU2_9TELE|nr:hypothetical protein AALO_G00106850 [Alosa alosa]